MATPSSPISFDRIYSEANGVAPVSPTSFKTLASSSYFEGPNGSNTVNYNAWGQSRGINGIYAVRALSTTPYKFDNYRDVSYYYDNFNYQVSLTVNNNSFNDFTVTVYYMDSSLTYNYLTMNAGTVTALSTFPPTSIATTNTPLIYGCNWNLQIDTDPFYGGGVNVAMDINGIGVLPSTAVPTMFPAPFFLDYTTNTNEFMTPGYPTNVLIPFTGATGSEIIINFL